MGGTKAGAAKARAKNLAKDPDFYKNIGSKSWKNPNRSRKTGFALQTPEERAENGRKGGKKTKAEYKTQTTTTAEADQDSSGVSE